MLRIFKLTHYPSSVKAGKPNFIATSTVRRLEQPTILSSRAMAGLQTSARNSLRASHFIR